MVLLPANDDPLVCDAFVRWASLQTAAPRHPESLIEQVEISHDYAGLLDTEVHGRRVVWKLVPGAARARVMAAPLSIEEVDAWSIEPATLRQRSDHIALCHACAGEKKIRCAACGGTGKTLCGACSGQRKVYGYTSNGAYRLLNCTACKGRGEIDCVQCRRGIAVCAACAGEGRVQSWMEVESWQRSLSKVYPHTIARRFAWDDRPASDAVARDAELVTEVTWPRPLTPDDLSDVPGEWLSVLRPEVTSEERITQQRLRIVRIPRHRVHYRLGSYDDSVTFHGLRLLDPDLGSGSAFGRRAARLRTLRVLLVVMALAIVLASLLRDAFFRGTWTFLSLLACGAAFVAIYVAAADFTSVRRHVRTSVFVAFAALVASILFAIAALPSLAHSRKLIAAGTLDDAESELRVLHASALTWSDLWLARVRQATGIDAARSALARIPAALPQHALAIKAVDELILRTARDAAGQHRWSDAARALALLSDGALGRPGTVTLAESVCVPSAREKIDRADWPGAANAILAARRVGVAPAALEPLDGAIRSAAVNAAATAEGANDPQARLQQRLAAEGTFVSWERATENWGTPSLIALRTEMARDVAAVERGARHRRNH